MTNQPSSQFQPAAIPDGRIDVDGDPHMRNGKGALVPLDLVKAQDQLRDETVRKIIGHALALQDQVARFKKHVFDDLEAYEDLLAQEYGATLGGAKGNKSLLSFDTCFKVSVAVADQIDCGPELQIAKALVDECMIEWAATSRIEIQAIITSAFNTDKEGKINRAEIVKLTKLDIDDTRWLSAMRAIKDAEHVVGKATYVRCHQRDAADKPWKHITIDLAKA
ncbi:DUF3164 family protein [Parasedimentitalea marina]